MMTRSQLVDLRRRVVARDAERAAEFLLKDGREYEAQQIVTQLSLEADARALARAFERRPDVVMSKDWRVGRSRGKYMHAAYWRSASPSTT